MTSERGIAAAQRYRDGELASAIAIDLGVKASTVFRWLQETGTPVDKRVALTPKEELDLMTRYQNGERVPKLLTEFGINAGTMRNIRLRHGVSARNRLPPTHRTYTDETAEQIVQDYLAGESQDSIGKKHGVSQSSISRILYRRGVVKNDLRARRAHHGKWKGGRVTTEHGYTLIRLYPEDPFFAMTNNTGYTPEHRYVIAKSLGRLLMPGETVHHINGDKTDNRLENLQLRQGQHGRGAAMACLDCGSHNIGPVPLG